MKLEIEQKELFQLDATKAIELIKARKITNENLINSIIEQIKKINPVTNAWVNLNFEQTLENSRKLDSKIRSGENIGPLYGIPIGIKDIFNTKDFPTEMGSPIWANFTPGNDARVAHAIRLANGIIMGKTESAEFAVHTLGKTKNPYDVKRSPGTSSSGSAVSVATRMVPLAIGTQTAGSIIRPASFCGVYGFKPSFGLIPRTGMLKTTDSLDQIGFFARTVEDLDLFFNIIRVKGINYPFSHSAFTDKQRQIIKDRPWKIKFVKSHVWDSAEPYAKKFLKEFVTKLSEHSDFEVEELDLPREFESSHEMHEKIYAKSLSYYFKDELKNKTLVSEVFYELASKSKNISYTQFNDAIKYQFKLGKILDKLFKEFDIIVSLSTAGHAPFRNEREKEDPSLIWTLCGNPAVSVPAFKTPEDLPMGLQIVCRKYNDLLLLQFLKSLKNKKLIPNGPYPLLVS